MAKIQPQSVGLAPELPRHIGIIMDGNGRYATRRGLPRKLGHRAGMERLRGLIRFSSDIGIEVLKSVFLYQPAFSSGIFLSEC